MPPVQTYLDHTCRLLVVTSLLTLLAGCGEREGNFSQYPGFAEWYEINPPSNALPSPDEEALLRQYQPRFYLADGDEGPIDFYRDYVARGRLVGGDQQLISDEVTQDLLNVHKSDPTVIFTHQPKDEKPNPVVYGRVTAENVAWPGCAEVLPLTFLSYHLVFRSSGLPSGLPWWQAGPLALIANLEDWHQLDHYTAITLALAPIKGERLLPIAATFQQHNYQRSYLLGEGEGEGEGAGRLPLPKDDRIEVDIATRSNELYPHQPGLTARRAMSFMDPKGAKYMVADGKAPWLAADDVTDPAIAIEPTLTFLRPDDAFYRFEGWLGERRRLPGRDGPPGADYNTLPPMKPLVHQMALSYWYEGDLAWLLLYNDLFEEGRPRSIDPTAFIEKMAKDLDPVC